MMKTIFVVDDSDINLSLAKKTLEDHYRVLTMSSAKKMFSLLEKITPDLILLDIEMPDIGGFEALLSLKSNPLYSEIPVVFLTGYTDNTIETRGYELGVADFITKPFSSLALINCVKTNLEKTLKEAM
jgi:putative two-component system response regulator